ncbi:nitrogen regulation protein NR(II) [Flocculibacter collagenilyticus]|uniref:nitrogen regulation protein NR(II) n=1 Tax=Flocculibacter collagenilyticus TaxID=2744479 RepID=UPI0018F7A2E1|nr:nitrogen regulation protein NR(II) [Flocculibacter collagenilyticus]
MNNLNTTQIVDIDIINSLSVAVVTVTADLNIVQINHAGVALFRCSEKRILERPLYAFFQQCDFDLDRISKIIEDGSSFSQSESQLIFHDSRPVLADINCNSINQYAVLEIKQIDMQKRISQESLLHHQHTASRELIRNLAHEIKNPLGGVRGAAQLLERNLNDIELKEYTQLIIEQADRLKNLVDRLLGPNKLLQREWVNIHQVLESVRKVIQVTMPMQASIVRDYDPSVPDVLIDAELVHQAVLNIAQNAQQAIQEDGIIKLSSRIMSQVVLNGKKHARVLAIGISDNGEGIPDELKGTLFFPMVSNKEDGNGLGLSIAQTLIHQHGGRIDCESWSGQTEFIIILPIGESQ